MMIVIESFQVKNITRPSVSYMIILSLFDQIHTSLVII